MIEVPFRISDIGEAGHRWMETFRWPVPMLQHFEISFSLLQRFTDFLLQLEGDERRVALLARPTNRVAILLEAAIVVTAEKEHNIRVIGPRDLHVLRGTLTSSNFVSDAEVMRPRADTIRFDALRRIVRTATWTKPWNFPSTLLKPDALAITHNSLLVSEAKRKGRGLKFERAENIIAEAATKSIKPVLSPDARDHLAMRMESCLLDEPRVNEDHRGVLSEICRPFIRDAVNRASELLGSLKAATNLPSEIWSGSGGPTEARAIGLEVKRRGGRAVRHDHGGSAALFGDCEFIVQQELAVSTDFVFSTPAAASTHTNLRAAQMISGSDTVAILGGHGDPSLRSRQSRAKPPTGRRKVMFVGTAYYGFSQTFPPFPPPAVYLNWQYRMLSALGQLPIDLYHKPHPGGLCRGDPPLLGAAAKTIAGAFEDLMTEFDLIVFDIAASTTYSVALASDKPIVLLDFGCMRFDPGVILEVKKRCRILNVFENAMGLPDVNSQELRDAICGPLDKVDSSYFRALLLNEPKA